MEIRTVMSKCTQHRRFTNSVYICVPHKFIRLWTRSFLSPKYALIFLFEPRARGNLEAAASGIIEQCPRAVSWLRARRTDGMKERERERERERGGSLIGQTVISLLTPDPFRIRTTCRSKYSLVRCRVFAQRLRMASTAWLEGEVDGMSKTEEDGSRMLNVWNGRKGERWGRERGEREREREREREGE